MTTLMDNPAHAAVCESVRRHTAQPVNGPELLFVYGGMRQNEIQLLLQQRHSATCVFWITEVPETLSPPLQTAVEDGRLAAVPVDGPVEFTFFAFFSPKLSREFVLLDAGRASDADTRRCEQVLRSLRDQVRLQVFNAGTLVTKGPLWQSNTLQNLPVILRSPGLEALREAFVDRPAVVVGAGPSLDGAMPHLKRMRDHFVVIATGTALGPLRKAGIRPDLVIAVDGSPLIGKQFNGPCEDLYLAASTLVYPGITRRFKGNFFGLLDLSPIDRWVADVTPVQGKLHAGGTVTACGMDLAARMGCAPVMTVGLDLSFDNAGPSHASGSMYDKNPLRDTLVPVPGNYEPEVYTTRQFHCYIDLVGLMVADRPDTLFLNVNDRGAKIDGMKLVGFTAFDEWAGEPFDARATIERLCRPPEESGGAVYEELLQISGYLDKVQVACRGGAMAANRLQLLQRRATAADREEMQACLQTIHDLDGLLENGSKRCAFLEMSLWPAAYSLSVDGASDEVGPARMRRFYEQIAGAAKWTRQLILRACAEAGVFETECVEEIRKGDDHG